MSPASAANVTERFVRLKDVLAMRLNAVGVTVTINDGAGTAHRWEADRLHAGSTSFALSMVAVELRRRDDSAKCTIDVSLPRVIRKPTSRCAW
jgi:hypothetical protein